MTEPLVADVPGGGGRLLHSRTLAARRLDGRPYPATTVDSIRESLALRLEATKTDRDWIDGIGEEERAAAQWAAQGEVLGAGRHAFTAWGACPEFMDELTSFGAFFFRSLVTSD